MLAFAGITGASILGATLGGTTLATWNATDGFTLQPVYSGDLNITFGLKDAYVQGINPNTNDGTPSFYRASDAKAEPALSALSSQDADAVPTYFLVDIDLDHAGDNLGAWLDLDLTAVTGVLGRPRTLSARLVDRLDHTTILPTISDGKVYATLEPTNAARSNAFTLNRDYEGVYAGTQVVDEQANPHDRIIIDADTPMQFTVVARISYEPFTRLGDLTALTLGDVLNINADYTQVRIP